MIESPQTLILLAVMCYLAYAVALIIHDRNNRK